MALPWDVHRHGRGRVQERRYSGTRDSLTGLARSTSSRPNTRDTLESCSDMYICRGLLKLHGKFSNHCIVILYEQVDSENDLARLFALPSTVVYQLPLKPHTAT